MTAEPAPQSILSYAVLHVDDVERSLGFYEQALGLERRFVDDRGVYGELETGATTLALTQRAFAAEQACAMAGGAPSEPPAPSELVFTVDDVERALARALDAGAVLVRAPATKYWGLVVAYVRDPDGHLLQLSTPV